MADEGKNFVHEAENWRQRIQFETQSSRAFEQQWGFMTQEASANKRPHQVSLVKYFNPHSPSWTVEAKRVPLPYGRTTSKGLQDENEATRRATATHNSRIDHINSTDPHYRQSSHSLGVRQSLETFGVAHFGIKSTLQDVAP